MWRNHRGHRIRTGGPGGRAVLTVNCGGETLLRGCNPIANGSVRIGLSMVGVGGMTIPPTSACVLSFFRISTTRSSCRSLP